jgi:hypothetical protein
MVGEKQPGRLFQLRDDLAPFVRKAFMATVIAERHRSHSIMLTSAWKKKLGVV